MFRFIMTGTILYNPKTNHNLLMLFVLNGNNKQIQSNFVLSLPIQGKQEISESDILFYFMSFNNFKSLRITVSKIFSK